MTSPNIKARTAANDNRLAGAKRTTLLAQYRAARDSFSSVDSAVNNLLDGQNAIGGKAMLAAYSFAIACTDRPAKAAKLPGWQDAAVHPSVNPYCQPLKLVAGDMDNVTQSRISIWAGVFRHAHSAKIKPVKFLAHLNRNHGMRRWYDAINASTKPATTAANDNRPGGGARKPSGAGGKATNSPHMDIVAQLKLAKRIAMVAIDLDAYMCDGDAQDDLESIPAVIGLVKATHTKCRKFVNDNDPRFAIKAVA